MHQFLPVRYPVLLGVLLAVLLSVPAHAGSSAGAGRPPVLAFYYTWYTPSTWCTCRMSDLPVTLYDSASTSTIDRQIRQATGAGISGFISSWWGIGDTTDHNFALLQSRAAALYHATSRLFTSTIYLETDSPRLGSERRIEQAIRYILATYSHSPYFFHWHGKPVLFIWDPLGGGRTLAAWSRIRSQVDPHHRSIWSAEGTDISLLTVFDGIHLFSAANWALADHTIGATDASFRAQIDAFNRSHGTRRLWAAGVVPGWNDMKVPGRRDPHIVPRRDGSTYRQSWEAALASRPGWITVTSFNEWFEGSMIEPGRHFGSRYLRITRQYATG